MSLAEVEKNKAVVRQWIDEVFTAKDMTSIDKLKVASYLDWTPFPGQRMDLPVSGIKQTVPTFMRSLPDFDFTEDNLFGEGDLVVCVGHWEANHEGEAFLGIPTTGKRVGGTRIDMFRVVGDKMVEHWGCGNELRFLEMLGIVPQDEAGGEAAGEKDARTVARSYVEEVINERSLAAINSSVNMHAVDHNSHSLSMCFTLTAFPDYGVEVEDVIAEGDKVTVVSTYSGTHSGEFMGIPATGKKVTGQRVDVFRVEDGEIVESWQDWHRASLVEQITA